MALPSPARRWPYPLALWGLVGLAAVPLCRRAWDAWQAHQIQWAQDLAFFHQILYAASQGRPWTSSLLLEPTGFLEMVHFHPIFALVLPLYLLAPHPLTLLLLNVWVVALAAIPLAGLARDRTGSRLFGLAAALSWLVWLPVQTAALADFNPMCFFVPGFLLVLQGVHRRSWGVLGVGAALCLLAREEASYLVAAVGATLVVLPFGGPRRREGAVLLLAGLGWFGLLCAIKGNFFFHFDPRNLLREGDGGTSPAEWLTRDRLGHVGLLVLGGYGPVILSPASLASCLGPLGYLFTAPGKEWHAFTGPYAFYRDTLIPFMAAGGVMGWAWVADRFPSRRKALLAAAAVAMVGGNLLAFHTARQRLTEGLWDRNRSEARSQETRALDALLARVPAQARVATDYALIAHLSGRRVLWNVNHLYLEDGRPPWWTAEWPLTLDRVDTVVIRLDDPFLSRLDDAWTLQERASGYGLWTRVRDPEGGYPEPLP